MKVQDFIVDLFSNDYFKAGSGLFGLALGTAVLRKSAQMFQSVVRRNHTMTLEIPSNDKSYQWVSPWLAKQTAATHVSVETAFHRSDAGKIVTHYQFIPSPGTHYFIYKKRIVKVERSRTQPTMAGQGGGTPFESLTLTTIGQNRLYFQTILNEAKKEALMQEEGWTIVYKAVGCEWRPFGYPRSKRPLDSVVLEEGLKEVIVNDVREFVDNEQWYRARGVPYRRGYLLHGPPGCGKSSFIAALAGELDYTVCILSLGEIGMSGDRLDHLLAHAPLQSIILLEDVDAAFASREDLHNKPAYQGMASLTLSGLLNALDGVASTEGRILFMTTNYPDRLDPALIRPGRVDLILKLSLCSLSQLKTMFLRFYPTSQQNLGDKFSNSIGPDKVSPAQVQGFLLCHKDKPEKALDQLPQLLQSCMVNQPLRHVS